MNVSLRPPADMITPLGSPDVMFAFDSFASGVLDVDELAERLYEICSEETSAIGDGLALADHYHRLGTLTSDDVERITADLERAAREAPATGPGELSAYVSQRLGFEEVPSPAEAASAVTTGVAASCCGPVSTSTNADTVASSCCGPASTAP